jgi:hypothetical protein
MSDRRTTAAELQAAISDGWLEAEQDAEDAESAEVGVSLADRAQALVDQLASEDDWLSSEVRAELAELGQALIADIDEELQGDSDIPHQTRQRAVHRGRDRERAAAWRTNEVLIDRMPQFLLFGDEQRDLDTKHVWGEHAKAPPALDNLFQLAKTDYQQLKLAAMADDRATMDSLQELANANLDEAFKAWRQADVHVAFSADRRALQLLIRDRATARRTRLDERSAGLRSFVALIAFNARYAGNIRPVLLIDEAEQHLHHGAQADLMRVFERQTAAETIIYTTHSIGCLPSDLGATIRVVTAGTG